MEKLYFPETYGLVLCGGNSRRMGKDKSLLKYYDKPQRYHLYDMLLPFCEKVFISCNAVQVNGIEDGYSFIEDTAVYADIGPMAALISAFIKFPKKNILLIGCDYPFLNAAELQQFLGCCKKMPAAFYNEHENVYEPLLAWYPTSSFTVLKEMLQGKKNSLQQFLKNAGAVKYYPQNKNSITSIDTIEGFNEVTTVLKP